MPTPVDLIALRSMTDGDAEMEKVLFEEFYSAFETGMAALKTDTTNGAGEEWRNEAHTLKGIALNIGAGALGTICTHAQEAYRASQVEKEALLSQIEAEYRRVRQFLLAIANTK